MNQLTNSLEEIISGYPIDEKWLVAPSLRTGRQWVDQLVSCGRKVVNLRPTTLRTLALNLAGPKMASGGFKLAPLLKKELITAELWNEYLRQSSTGKYLRNIEPDFSLVRALSSTIDSIRLAGIGPRVIQEATFHSKIKKEELCHLLIKYEAMLREHRLIDYPEALQLAVNRVNDARLPSHILILVPETELLQCEVMEQKLLDTLPHDQLYKLEVDRPRSAPAGENADYSAKSISQLRWVGAPVDAPAPKQDNSIDFFRAAGAANEIREVFRRCSENAIPLDQVEIIYSDSGTYLPLLHELASAMFEHHDPQKDSYAVSFGEGLPAVYSRPGKALKAWIDWQKSGFDQVVLERIIHDGLLKRPNEYVDHIKISYSELADALRTIPVHQGYHNYIPKIDEQLNAKSNMLAEPALDESGEPLYDEHIVQRDIQKLKAVRTLLEKLLAYTPENNIRYADFLLNTKRFLNNCVNSAGQFDEYVRNKFIDDIDQMLDYLDSSTVFSKAFTSCSDIPQNVLGGAEPPQGPANGLKLDLMQWVKELPLNSKIAGLPPQPGALHASNILNGGHSGRPYTFIVGLDDSRFPRATIQDPLLLDYERLNISDNLITSERRAERDIKKFEALLARLRGKVTLSYAGRSVEDDSELSPSPMLINAFRAVTGNLTANIEVFLISELLGTEKAFAPEDESCCLSLTDALMGLLCLAKPTDDRRGLVAEFFPDISFGLEAERNRKCDVLTCYDGFVPQAGKDFSPFNRKDRPLSPSRLQGLAKCPLQFFFQNILGLELPDEFKYDPDIWLDPLQKGTVLHEVFHLFIAEMLNRKEIPDAENPEHLHFIFELLDSEMERIRRVSPPPRHDLEMSTRNILRLACRIFLYGQNELYDSGRPKFLEASIGLKNMGHSPLDTAEPVKMPLDVNNKAIYLRGRVDRIDELNHGGGKVFSVWDYKTGSSKRYENGKKGVFNEGQLVQHFVYKYIAQACLSDHLKSPVSVEFFGYFFPSAKARGEIIKYTDAQLRGGKRVLNLLCTALTDGAFVALRDTNSCKYCDFADICEDVNSVAEWAGKKMDNEANKVLQPFRELKENY